MPCKPVHLSAVRRRTSGFRNRNQVQWMLSANRVKQLYWERKYRACAALCQEVVESDLSLHPQYQAFLHFYSAISHESLGLVAHDFSSNKLALLNAAKDAFESAFEALSAPYVSGKDGGYKTQVPVAANHHLGHSPMTSGASVLPARYAFTEADLDWSDEDETSPYGIPVPDFSKYAPRQMLDLDYLAQQKARLSSSLSSTHVLQEELLPAPLFVKKEVANIEASLATSTLHPPMTEGKWSLRKRAQLQAPESAVDSTRQETYHLQSCMSPAAPAANNSLWTSFTHQLLGHVSSIEEAIYQATFMQRVRKEKRDTRVTDEEDAQTRSKLERVQRLRKSGWNVRKECHGYKGRQYYDEVIGRALDELRLVEKEVPPSMGHI